MTDEHRDMSDEHVEDITCITCEGVFILQEGEQGFYIQRGLSLPKRCSSCRAERKAQKMREQTRAAPQKQPTTKQVTCQHCERLTILPFIPQEGSDVYCRICWEGVKNVGLAGAVYV